MIERRIHSERLGTELTMRDFSIEDADAIADFFASADKTYLGRDYANLLQFSDPQRVREELPSFLTYYGPNRLLKGIWQGDLLIGGGVLGFSEEDGRKVASIAGISRKGYEGKGLSEYILDWAKEETQLRPGYVLEALVRIGNEKEEAAAQALVDKAGFKENGSKDGWRRFVYEF